jgi:hypothetical protein
MSTPQLQTLMRETLAGAMQGMGLDADSLWRGYVAVGGSELPRVVDDLLAGRQTLEPNEYDFLAQAINDHAVSLGQRSVVPYFHQLGGD